MTKYAALIDRKEDVRYHVEKALFFMKNGRRGPVWLDIPLDVQSAQIDADALKGYDPGENPEQNYPPLDRSLVPVIAEKLKEAKRPVLFGGFGVRAAGAAEEFKELSMLLGIPVLTGMSSVDLIPESWPYYAGRTGMSGGRGGNLNMAGSDLFLSIGSRLSFIQTGYAYESWAREAYTIVNEIDPEELKKPNVRVDLPVISDAKELLKALIRELRDRGASPEKPYCEGASGWTERARARYARYPLVTEAHRGPQPDGQANIYAFYECLSGLLSGGEPLLVSVGQARMIGSQAYQVPEKGRFYTNSATASMGYGLPAAIGLARAYEREGIETAVNLSNGEGCMMMNLQELQTIATNHLPIRVFVICNDGYHSIRQTQRNFFGDPLVGVGPESGDLDFPAVSKLADTFGFSYAACLKNESLEEDLEAAFALPLPALIEVQVGSLQNMEPKAASRRLPDGSMVSSPLEDMAPFLSREELAAELEIPLTEAEARE